MLYKAIEYDQTRIGINIPNKPYKYFVWLYIYFKSDVISYKKYQSYGKMTPKIHHYLYFFTKLHLEI